MEIHLTKMQSLLQGFEVSPFWSSHIISYDGFSKNLILPDSIGGVTLDTIHTDAFNGVDLESITLPNTITTIHPLAFGPTDMELPLIIADLDSPVYKLAISRGWKVRAKESSLAVKKSSIFSSTV